MVFAIAVAAGALVAGAVAAVSGFGIGSLLTPIFSLRMDLKLAVAAVSVPHFLATALRFWMLRAHVSWPVVAGFGLASAAGGLLGALLHLWLKSAILSLIFGALLVFAGITGLGGLTKRMRFGPTAAWIAGGASGILGGLVGNQGGIRSAALMGFDIPKQAFVATATAIALAVDGARLPVYLATGYRDLLGVWPLILTASLASLAGTLVGARVLGRIPESIYQRVVSGLILILGVAMLVTSLRHILRG